MKVALLNDWMKGGGAERSMAYIANGVASKGLPVDLIALESGLSYSLNKDVNYSYIRASYSSKIHKLVSMPLDAFKLARRSKKKSYDLVLSFQLRSNIINILSGFFKGNHKVIISERVNPELFYSNQWYSFIAFPVIRFFYNRSDHITCNSFETRDSLIKLGINKPISVITNGYDKDKIVERSKEELSKTEEELFSFDKVNVLLLGRFSKQKGQLQAIDAFNMMSNKENFNLILIGDGDDKERIKKKINRLNLQDLVKIHPFVENPYKLINKADFLLMPSIYEGYPNVACESIILKRPILAFNFKSASSELINDKNGVLVEVNDIASLSRQMECFHYKEYNVDGSSIITVNELVKKYMDLFYEI